MNAVRPLFVYSYFFIIFIFPLSLGSLCEVTFEIYNASQSSNINIVPGQMPYVYKLSESETDSRKSDMSDEINYTKEKHSNEQDQ